MIFSNPLFMPFRLKVCRMHSALMRSELLTKEFVRHFPMPNMLLNRKSTVFQLLLNMKTVFLSEVQPEATV